jgi:hypothetical protein
MDRTTRSCQLCGRRLARGEVSYKLVNPEVLAPPVGEDVLLGITEELGVCCHGCRKRHMELLAERPETGERLYGWVEREMYCVTSGEE